VRVLAKRVGISPTTVQKWRKRTTTADAKIEALPDLIHTLLTDNGVQFTARKQDISATPSLGS
jgi:hypothetical protein